MRNFLIGLILILWTANIAESKPISADLSSHKIEIHAGFNGTQLLLYGTREDAGDIVVLIRGPLTDYVVRKKERTFGLWMNRANANFSEVPQFYHIASTKPLTQIYQQGLFDQLNIHIPSAPKLGDKADFEHAMERIFVEQALYSPVAASISFMGESLFKANFVFPDHMPLGRYSAEAYLFSDGQLVGMQAIPIHVFKTGFDALIHDLSRDHGLIYGILAVLLAASIGWAGSWLFQRLQ